MEKTNFLVSLLKITKPSPACVSPPWDLAETEWRDLPSRIDLLTTERVECLGKFWLPPQMCSHGYEPAEGLF